MELQDLIIIFLIIIIPIILIFSYYLNLQSNTIKMQTDYDEKLIEATKEAVEAFEINTTELNSEYNTLANLKRRDLLASVNVFTTSLSSKLGIGGTSKENILNYIPAIVFTMYDGYYIYSPTHIPKSIANDKGIQMFYYRTATTEGTNKFVAAATQRIGGYAVSGEPMYEYDSSKEGSSPESITYEGKYFTTNAEYAKTTYKHVLKTFVPYSATMDGYTVNYTLGNYVRIYGYGESKESREGYIDPSTSNFATKKDSSSHIAIINTYKNVLIDKETLTENIPVKIGDEVIIREYKYVYNTNTDKRYYNDYDDDGDGIPDNKFFITDGEYNIRYLPEVEPNNSLAEFKKVLIRDTSSDTDYKELYQILNSNSGTGEWYVYIASEKKYEKYTGEIPNIQIYEDCSGINYTVETACFNQWLKGKIDGESLLAQKREKIVDNINNNLNLSISNYSANSSINYKIPELTDLDWDQALSNISMIAFFQGIKIGLKTYNNYAIVTSTENNEFVNENSMYYLDSNDSYYHIYPCGEAKGDTIGNEGGYRNTEFKLKRFTKTIGETVYYYMHTNYTDPDETTKIQQPTYGIRQCFNCIVNRNKMAEAEKENWKKISSTAVAREEYIQMCRTRLTDNNAKIALTPEQFNAQFEDYYGMAVPAEKAREFIQKVITNNDIYSEHKIKVYVYAWATGFVDTSYIEREDLQTKIYNLIQTGKTYQIGPADEWHTEKDASGYLTQIYFEEN